MKVTTMDDRREPHGASHRPRGGGGRKIRGAGREFRDGWLGRLFRGRRIDRNPLRRASDRAETVILAGLLAAFLAGGPFAALAGGGLARDLAVHVQQTQLATERQVTAVTTEGATSSRGLGISYAEVTARWTAPDGRPASDVIPVALGTAAGTKEPVWVTMDGKLAAPPMLESQISNLEMLGQMGTVALLALVLLVAWQLARHELNRHRYAAWDADWQAIDPRGRQRR
jgi:hypothetical protein